jgi:hypothetical protein
VGKIDGLGGSGHGQYFSTQGMPGWHHVWPKGAKGRPHPAEHKARIFAGIWTPLCVESLSAAISSFYSYFLLFKFSI